MKTQQIPFSPKPKLVDLHQQTILELVRKQSELTKQLKAAHEEIARLNYLYNP